MTQGSYRAAIYRGPGKVDVVDLPYPACGPDEVVVRNLMSGVCGSDVSAYRDGGDDHMIWADHEFGHEAISEIVEIGGEVKDLAVGDHVFVMGNALRDRRRVATVGGFSEYIRIPQCELGYSVLKIDKAIPLRTAVLFEPFVIGTRGALNLSPGPHKTGIVFGAGIIGLSAAIMMKWYGCPKVMVVDLSDFRLRNAEKFGLLTCNPQKEDLLAKAIAEFGPGVAFGGERCDADIYLEATGVKAAVDSFMGIAKREAQLGIVGVHHHPVPLDLMRVCYNNWQIKGCGTSGIVEMGPDILAMMQSGRFDLEALVTHEYDIEQINEALQMGARADQAQKVCISFA